MLGYRIICEFCCCVKGFKMMHDWSYQPPQGREIHLTEPPQAPNRSAWIPEGAWGDVGAEFCQSFQTYEIDVSLMREIRQETQPNELILLFWKATLTEICKSEITSLTLSSPLRSKKLRRVSSEPFSPSTSLLWTELPFILQSPWLHLFTLSPKVVSAYNISILKGTGDVIRMLFWHLEVVRAWISYNRLKPS